MLDESFEGVGQFVGRVASGAQDGSGGCSDRLQLQAQRSAGAFGCLGDPMSDARQLPRPAVRPPPPVRVQAGLGAEEQREQVALADSVDRTVMDLGHHRARAVGQPADEQQLPQRTGTVQLLLGEPDRFGAHGRLVGRSAEVGEGDVLIEVEVGVIDPPRTPDDQARGSQLASQQGSQVQAGLDLVEQLVCGHLAVQQRQERDVSDADRSVEGEEGGIERGELSCLHAHLLVERRRSVTLASLGLARQPVRRGA
jgi:hypothetical protein